jgi:hypothetical protein
MGPKNNEIQKREPIGVIEIPEKLITDMQKTLDDCLPITSKASQTLSDSIVIANGLNSLREFFQNDEVKKLVITMQDSTVGFLTDREPVALARYNAKQSPDWKKQPYSYDEIVEALIPPMLDGYRFTGNEINIINGNGMPVKNGKHRKIRESVSNFTHRVGVPDVDKGVARMKCEARWTKDGEEQSIGYGDEKCIVAVSIHKSDGIDKWIGLAESKLFSRVLTRISGKLVIEGDVPEPEEKNITPDVESGSSVNIG